MGHRSSLAEVGFVCFILCFVLKSKKKQHAAHLTSTPSKRQGKRSLVYKPQKTQNKLWTVLHTKLFFFSKVASLNGCNWYPGNGKVLYSAGSTFCHTAHSGKGKPNTGNVFSAQANIDTRIIFFKIVCSVNLGAFIIWSKHVWIYWKPSRCFSLARGQRKGGIK